MRQDSPLIWALLVALLAGCQTMPRTVRKESCEDRIISYSEWPKVKDPAWHLDLIVPNGGHLFYSGVDHSDDPTHAQFKEIDEAWADVRPTLAFYEGPDRGTADSREETIGKYGESGYVRFLAKLDGITVRRLNPPPEEYLKYLLDHFPPDQVSLFLLLGEAARLRERKDASLSDVETGIRALMEKASTIPGGERLIRDIPSLETTYKKYWSEPADWRQAPQRWFTPGDDPKKTGGIFTNTINRVSSEFRDRYMVQVLSEAALKGERVFAVVGANHVPMQAPALECRLTRDVGTSRISPAPKLVANKHLRSPFQEMAVIRLDGSELRFYIAKSRSDATIAKPLVIFLDGSGCNSQFFIRGQDLYLSNYGVLARLALPWGITAAPERRGVPFGHDGEGGTAENCPADFIAHATRDERISDTVLLIQSLKNLGWINSKILLVGHSEGADIAAGASEALPEVSHVVFLSGGGPTQMFDFMVLKRRKLQAEGKSPEEIDSEIKKLESSYRDVFLHPDSTEKFFMGHAYRRWSSYFLHPPMKSLLNSKAKLYVAHGTEDDSVPIEAFDLLTVELLRTKRAGVTVRRFPGRDHGLGEPDRSLKGPPMEPIFKDILAWFQDESRKSSKAPVR